MAQKQWLLSNPDLSHLRMALATEIDQHRKSVRPVPHHLENLEELASKLDAIRENTAREFSNENDMDGQVCEQLLVTLIPMSYDDWRREDPYTVVPIGKKFAVVLKSNPGRPVGEKTYTHATHAHRARRRLNEAAREALAVEDSNDGE